MVRKIKSPLRRLRQPSQGYAGLIVTFVICSFVICSFATRTAQAQSGAWAAVMAQANALYEAGDYTGAIETYQQIMDGGIQHSGVYYNMGNAYYKSGDLGRAVLNYERARRLTPRDEDIRANLAFARAQVADQFPITEEGAVWAAITGWHEALTVNETAWVAWALFAVVCSLGILATFAYRWRRLALTGAAVVCIVLALVLLSLGLKVHELNQDHAVIVATEVNVYSGPGDTYLLEFTLHAGTMLTVVEEREGWVRGELSGDFQGWLTAEAAEFVEE